MPRRRNEVWQTVSVRPLTGQVDTRSEIEDVALGAWRWKQNTQLTGGTKLCSRPQWDVAFAGYTNPNLTPPAYSNFDLHDQAVAPGGVTQQYVTLLFNATDNAGNSYLFAGLQDSIWVLNQTTGYWSRIISGLGGPMQPSLPQIRFRMAELQNTVVFTNNNDPPMYSTLGSPNASTIPDLVTLGVTQAGIVFQWNGFMFLMDCVEGGTRISSRIHWSSLNCPLSWIPAPPSPGVQLDCNNVNTLAGFQDLDYGSRILGAAVMAGQLYVFTTVAIWVVFLNSSTATGAPTFNFARVYYEPKAGYKCLAYPNTLVSTGQEVWYASTDGFYRFNPYIPEPIRDEWLYKASAMVFNDNLSALDLSCCQSAVMELFPDRNEMYFSWPQVSANPSGGCLNSATIAIDYMYKSVDYIDYGFSAFVNFQPTPANPELCPSVEMFIGASIQDYCLKEIGGIYSRALCTNAGTGQGTIVDGLYIPFTGTYQYVGYYQILRALLPLLNFDREKYIRNFLLECTPAASSTANVVHLRIGTSESEADPNLPDGPCSVLWYPMPDKPLACNTAQKSSALVAQNLNPVPEFTWPMLQAGRFIYFEITIQAADGSPAIGGNCCLSRIETEIRLGTK